jgi:hypothetical protein
MFPKLGNTNDADLTEAAVRQFETAYEVTKSGGQEQWSAIFSGRTAENSGDPRSAQGAWPEVAR